MDASSTTQHPRVLEFAVDGMTCGHCAQSVRREVGAIDGVADVAVDLDAARVTVQGSELVEQVLLDAITQAGYDARMA